MQTNTPAPGTQIPCKSTGGVLTYTKHGFTHTGGRYGSTSSEKTDQL